MTAPITVSADQPALACGAFSARSALHQVIGEAPEGDVLQGSQLPSPTTHVLPPTRITAQVGVQRGLQVGLWDPGSSCGSLSPLPSSRGREGAPHSDGWKPSCSWAVPRDVPWPHAGSGSGLKAGVGSGLPGEAWRSEDGRRPAGRTGRGAGQVQGTQRIWGARMEPARRLRGTAGRCQCQLWPPGPWRPRGPHLEEDEDRRAGGVGRGGVGRKQQFEAQIHSEESGCSGHRDRGRSRPHTQPLPRGRHGGTSATGESSPRLPLPWM